MQLADILQQIGGLQAMARELGVTESQAATGAEAPLPATLGGFKRQVLAHPAGLGGLGDMLGQLGGVPLLDEVLASEPTDPNRGNEVLGRVFGSREISRTIAQHASAQSGLDASVLKRLLPLLVMLVVGVMAKQHRGASPQPNAPAGSAGLDGLLGRLLGGGPAGATAGVSHDSGLGALLDLNGDGNPLDDILRIAGAALR